MLKTSARSELCLRLVGFSLAGSSTRESTFWRVSAVSAAIVIGRQRSKLRGMGCEQDKDDETGSKDGA